MFQVPTFSSPPSTPDSRSKSKQSTNFFRASNLSNTPAGAPATGFSLPSTTPAGPPPSSVFGSANYNSSIPYNSNRYGNTLSRSSPLRQPTTQPEDDMDAMDEDQDMDMNSYVQSNDQPIQSVEGFNVAAIAKAVSRRPAPLSEDDDIILETEQIIENVHTFVQNSIAAADHLDPILATAVHDLLNVWVSQQDLDGSGGAIGPGHSASPLVQAGFICTLLLPLQHPSMRSKQHNSIFRTSTAPDQPKPIPQVLVEWLERYHNPYPEEFHDVLNFLPNTCANDRFWDVVLSRVSRGALSEALQLLKQADFREAETAIQDGAEERGYRNKQLGTVTKVVNRAVTVLEACPAVQFDDWQVSNSDWSIFRKRVRQASDDLTTISQGPHQGQDDDAFEAENFGLSSVRSENFALSTMSRRAESAVPYTVYEALKELYSILQGSRAQIVAAAADWVEATINQTIWWDGDQEDAVTDFAASRRSVAPIRPQSNRSVDLMPRTAYRQQLSKSLRHVLADYQDAELQINTTSTTQVGLSCILDDDLDGVMTTLRGLSPTVSAAVVEIAKLGNWPGNDGASSQDLMSQFSQSDLMVLSYSQKQPARDGNGHDEVLKFYADALYHHKTLKSTGGNVVKEGWEMAVQVMARISNATAANRHITEYLDQLDMESQDTTRIEKVMTLCHRMAIPAVAQRMAERYATYLADNTHNYGGALYYFARAHNLSRVKEVLDLLISSCLIQSSAYPSHAELDSTLDSIINSPKQTLAQLSMLDHEAAEMLSAHFSGYAMLRSFYTLRDQGLQPHDSIPRPALGPHARKQAAAAALIAVITSAVDSIHGGLYDASVDSVVPVDGLLVLLGEALVFVNPPNPLTRKPIFTPTQSLTLLSAIESLATLPATSSIHTACVDVLRATLAHCHDDDGESSASDILSKSTSSHFSFSIIGKSDESLNKSTGKLKSLSTNVKRGWDWRTGMRKDATSEDVLKILRLGLAKEIAGQWVG